MSDPRHECSGFKSQHDVSGPPNTEDSSTTAVCQKQHLNAASQLYPGAASVT